MATGQLWQGPYLDPGKTTCIGGAYDQASGFCSPGTKRTLLREAVGQWFPAEVIGTAAPMFQGQYQFSTNCNLDENMQGVCWGKFEISLQDGGKWKGAWSGAFDLRFYIASVSMVGHGHDGNVGGLQLKLAAMSPGGLPYFTFLGEVMGR
jgi:hypothetical protein